MNKKRLKLPNGNYLVITQNEDMYYSFEMFIDIENADGVYLRPVAIIRPSYINLKDELTATLRENARPWKGGENGIIKDRFEVLTPVGEDDFERVEFPTVPEFYDWLPYIELRKHPEKSMVPVASQNSELCYWRLSDSCLVHQRSRVPLGKIEKIRAPSGTLHKGENKMKELSYSQMAALFRAVESVTNQYVHVEGNIVFTKDSFTKEYTETQRTYVTTSNNKAFQPNMGGYSIYGSSLDGTDRMIRLEGYMRAEKGGKDGWEVERCYMPDDDYTIAIEAYAKQRLNSLKKSITPDSPCPRCGGKMALRNAISRYADLDICPDCGTEEALLDLAGKPKRASQWWVFSDGKLLEGVK